MVGRIELNPAWPWAQNYRIAQGVQVGDTVYVSGQVAYDAQGRVVGGDDMEAQAGQVFANIGSVLAEAGASMDDVVKITAYITDMSRYAGYASARARAFPNAIPASATVATPALVDPALLVEVEAVAKIGSGGRE